MLVVIHVVMAISSVMYTTYLFVRPSKRKFMVNYGLIAATVASGTWLTLATHTPLLSACVTGLLYVTVVTAGTIGAQLRLVRDHLADS